MPIDTTPSTVATNALQAIPFSSLIGGPLNACIEAQAMAAKTTWEFIKNVGLNEDKATGQRSAINVNFQYQKGSEMAVLVVPLLTIVPIPYIAIDTIDINFKANISASSSSTQEDTSSTQFGGELSAHAEFGYGPFKVSADFKANYSSKKDSKATQDSKYSVEYTMDVAVHAGQDSMPAGLATVLGILRESITSGTPGGTIRVSAQNLALATAAPNNTINVSASYYNDQNLMAKGNDPNPIAITFATTDTNLTLAAVTGTAASGATGQSVAVTPDSNGVATVSITAANNFAGPSTLNVTSANNTSAQVGVTKVTA
jgi:hypothetical protein